VLHIAVRRSTDVTYLTSDPGAEIDGLRAGPPGYWLRGEGRAHDPEDASAVLTRSSRGLVCGFDIVVAAPRPYSILVALDPDQGRAVVAAHREAVAVAMDYLSSRALVVRDQRGGDDTGRPTSWSRVLAFTHGVNRHGEPHVHDHVLVGARPVGEDRSIDARALFAHKATADALYCAHFRYLLGLTTTWSAFRSYAGNELVAGLDEGYRTLWGGRHATRGEKRLWRRDDTVAAWRADLRRFAPEGVVPPPRVPHRLNEQSFQRDLAGRSVIYRRDVVAAFANAATGGLDARTLPHVIDELYPQCRDGVGLREPGLTFAEATMMERVRRRGPRPLQRPSLRLWSRDQADGGPVGHRREAPIPVGGREFDPAW